MTRRGPKGTGAVGLAWVKRADLERMGGNPKKPLTRMQMAEAKGSLIRFGFASAVVVWRGTIYAGNTRLAALDAIRESDPELAHPDLATLRESLAMGPDFVPVRLASFASEAEARAYAVRDNRPLSDSDEPALSEHLQKLASAGTEIRGLGFSDAELRRLSRVGGGSGEGRVTLTAEVTCPNCSHTFRRR